jgi:hypothetical protein
MAITLPRVRVSARDLAILADARRRLAAMTGRVGLAAAVEALTAAVEAAIPGGRVFVIGDGPIVGSQISGIGIVDTPQGIDVVCVARDGRVIRLERFA